MVTVAGLPVTGLGGATLGTADEVADEDVLPEVALDAGEEASGDEVELPSEQLAKVATRPTQAAVRSAEFMSVGYSFAGISPPRLWTGW